jgi:hypothetical protein
MTTDYFKNNKTTIKNFLLFFCKPPISNQKAASSTSECKKKLHTQLALPYAFV